MSTQRSIAIALLAVSGAILIAAFGRVGVDFVSGLPSASTNDAGGLIVAADLVLPTTVEETPVSSTLAHPLAAYDESRLSSATGPTRGDELPAELYAAPAVHLREVASLALDPGAYDATPVVIGRWSGADIVVENVCFSNCPLDLEQVIHFDVPEGQSCEQLQGVERAIATRARSGRFEDRVFCVPNALTQN